MLSVPSPLEELTGQWGTHNALRVVGAMCRVLWEPGGWREDLQSGRASPGGRLEVQVGVCQERKDQRASRYWPQCVQIGGGSDVGRGSQERVKAMVWGLLSPLGSDEHAPCSARTR